MKRRLASKYCTLPSDDLESQGPGTWIEVRKKLTLGNLVPVIRMAQFGDDARLKGGDPAAMTAALDELMSGMAAAIRPLVVGWNWVTDVEAELAASPSMSGERVTLRLAEPLPEDAAGLPLYLGRFPDAYFDLRACEASPDGKTVTARGALDRACVPGEDYVIVGLPAPSEPGAWERLGIEEMFWLIRAITERFKSSVAGPKA